MKFIYEEFIAFRTDSISTHDQTIELSAYDRITKELFSLEHDYLSIRNHASIAVRELNSDGLASFSVKEESVRREDVVEFFCSLDTAGLPAARSVQKITCITYAF
jgi:hypothetical protein